MSHTAEDDSKKAQEKEDRKNEERQRIDVYEVWNEVQRTVNREKIEYENAKRTAPYWKTVRIFVSSTFRDFHTEREELVKKVFPELRTWCEERKVHLVDCDLRWGVPADTQYEITLRICLDEINRCYEDNVMPYFMNMTSKRIGWIPMKEELTEEIISEFDLIIGLSVTEMEIVHAAYRQDNPNALFFIRDDSFTDSIADETVRKQFIDELQPIASKKLKMLKQKIEERFPRENVCAYTCSYVHDEKRDPKDRPRLQLDNSFSAKVLEFFKTRIELQYPVVEAGNLDKFQIAHGQQEAFMKDRGANVVGREETLQEVCDYITSTSETEPLVILGDSGAGKSAFMALVADKFTEEPKQDGLLLFYHFIGATPGSTSLLNTLLRFLKSVESLSPEGYELPTDLNDATRDTSNILGQGHPNNKLVVIIDAINQFDGDVKDQLYSWLPRTLGANVRCVLSMVNGSPAHEALKGRGLKDASLRILPVLDLEQKSEIVTEYLKRFRKTLDSRQLLKLLNKKSSDNPLWLKIACEELRVYGDFKKLTEQIAKLPDSLNGLLKSVLKRYATDIGEENLLKSTLCLLEVSAIGLLEVELLEILAKIDGTPDQSGTDGVTTRLPAAKWASVYRNLRPFLRPFGNAGEGRLYFYHQSLRDVVKMEYLNTGTGSLEWHSHLANYFETSGSYERKIEEYPYHLIKLIACNHDKQRNSRRLERFLCDWKAFDMLYDSEFSESLMMYWRRVGTDENNRYNRMVICYEEELDKVRRDPDATHEERREKLENISRLFTQAGLYGEALPLAKECLSIITQAEESEEKQENLMYIYGHMANIETQNMPFTQSSKEIPIFEKIIEYHDQAIQIINELKKKEDRSIQRYKALQLMKKGFSLGQIADRTSGFFSKGKQQQYRAAGLENANEAVQIYNSLHDIRHLLEAYLTQGTLYVDTQKRHELNKRAISLCEQSFGPYDQFIARVSYNEGIAYEDEKDYKQAYSNFRRAYKVANELLGSSHPKTQKFKQALMEGRYKKIAKELNDDLEKLFMSNV